MILSYANRGLMNACAPLLSGRRAPLLRSLVNHTANRCTFGGRRYRALSEEIAKLDAQVHRLVAQAAPELIPFRPSARTTPRRLGRRGDNAERLGSETSSASLCSVSPVEASSVRVVRHRLNRGGNRDANRALHLICIVRMRVDEHTRRYAAKRASEGKSKREIIRCLKRYVRRVFRIHTPLL